ncbi:hypothetical protein HZQ11_12340 [Elizabethkingia anophelis]|uniref:hypothetical protein n=1 Tax=Elizabethkingia TaxID=308865 RepID=UPI0007399053|nr:MULTISPECIES: hypothetical protein [Elizabethkingia]KUF46414.1 hypothetical protein AS358_14525 [Elizabethkingia anophelis]MCT3645170.1 hypothetical protein [Elizabethkingia anophelis]MCT3652977.1 hypothetical protein [Elizabethkingia anophelis]MCT3656153.1 hypothetical protein [Elizabethkingia anophelis]MCT3660201.1 hypothetical protein [Elizabethkingia anophelis]
MKKKNSIELKYLQSGQLTVRWSDVIDKYNIPDCLIGANMNFYLIVNIIDKVFPGLKYLKDYEVCRNPVDYSVKDIKFTYNALIYIAYKLNEPNILYGQNLGVIKLLDDVQNRFNHFQSEFTKN